MGIFFSLSFLKTFSVVESRLFIEGLFWTIRAGKCIKLVCLVDFNWNNIFSVVCLCPYILLYESSLFILQLILPSKPAFMLIHLNFFLSLNACNFFLTTDFRFPYHWSDYRGLLSSNRLTGKADVIFFFFSSLVGQWVLVFLLRQGEIWYRENIF